MVQKQKATPIEIGVAFLENRRKCNLTPASASVPRDRDLPGQIPEGAWT